jgi:cytochrome c oxidase assembly protein subunit 15
VASLVANIGIVITGGVVRLTDSGLGCPTWPRCTEASYVTHPALGVHGVIEFGNRLLTFVLILIAVLTFLAARTARTPAGRPRRDLRRLTALLALGIPLQGVIGGISVLTRLNPYVVGLHLLVSMGLIGLSVWLVRLTWKSSAVPAGPSGFWSARLAFVAYGLAILLGVLVTGSGPHAGDADAVRNGLDPVLLSHLHAAAVYVGLAATALCWWLTRARQALVLLAIAAGQAAVGLAQYHLGLPIGLVALHLLGASLAMAASTNLLLSVSPVPDGDGRPAGVHAERAVLLSD